MQWIVHRGCCIHCGGDEENKGKEQHACASVLVERVSAGRERHGAKQQPHQLELQHSIRQTSVREKLHLNWR